MSAQIRQLARSIPFTAHSIDLSIALQLTPIRGRFDEIFDFVESLIRSFLKLGELSEMVGATQTSNCSKYTVAISIHLQVWQTLLRCKLHDISLATVSGTTLRRL